MNSPSSSAEYPKNHLKLKDARRFDEDALLKSSHDSIDIKSIIIISGVRI